MQYFELIQSKQVECPICPQKKEGMRLQPLLQEKEFEKMEDLSLAYAQGEDWEEYCDFLLEPTLLCSERLKRNFSGYEPKIRWKTVQIIAKKAGKEDLGLYGIPWFPVVDGVHEATTYYDYGLWKTLFLKQEVLGTYAIFQVLERRQRRIFVSLEVAESLLRERYLGIGFRKVEGR